MKTALKNHYDNLLNTQTEWKNFLSAVEKEKEEKIKTEFENSNLMAWTSEGIIYMFDKGTLSPMEKLVLDKANLYIIPQFCVRNFVFHQGKEACIKEIQKEITLLDYTLNQVRTNL